MTLDEYIASLDPQRKNYSTKYLVEAFRVAGYPRSDSSIFRQEAKGNLIIPHSPSDYKKVNGKIGFTRQLSAQMIKHIVEAFTPGGKGAYDYKKDPAI